MSESDTSVESIDNVASVPALAEVSINLLSKNRRKRRKTSHIAQISAKQRVEQLKNPDLYADAEILFCRVCENSLDQSRKGTITSYFKSEFYIENKKGSKENSKNQATLKIPLPVKTEASLENLKTRFDLLKMLAAANIPFNVAENPHVPNYFAKIIRGGGAIPRSDALNHYLTDSFNVEKYPLKSCQRFGTPN